MKMEILNNIISFIREIFNNNYALRTLIFRDFQSRYLASYIGLPWAFIQPTAYILIIWFAFTVGLRSGNTPTGLPFAAWLMVAMIPWLYISQTMMVSSKSLAEYSYLIRKTNVNPALIPLIKVFSGLLVHIVLLVLIMLILIFNYKIYPSIYWIQIFYYLFATMVVLSGIAWFISAVDVFMSDMGHVVSIFSTMLFWATPIIWPYSRLEGNYRYIALLNPFFYITEGYRYTFLQQKWFFQFVEMNIFFWTITILIFIIGALTFQKLRPDFGDVL